jgi:poly(3-hydroxybutyrate) depolymerase
MQRAFILLIAGSCLFAGVAGACAFSRRGTSQVWTISVNGMTRQHMLYIPAHLPAGPSLVLYLHGTHGGM